MVIPLLCVVVDNTPGGVGSSSAIDGTVGVAETGEPDVPDEPVVPTGYVESLGFYGIFRVSETIGLVSSAFTLVTIALILPSMCCVQIPLVGCGMLGNQWNCWLCCTRLVHRTR